MCVCCKLKCCCDGIYWYGIYILLTVNVIIGLTPTLINGHTYTGQIRMSYYGLQSKICGDKWNDAVANVTCKQMGYFGGVAIKYRTYTAARAVWNFKFNCTGNETSLLKCIDFTSQPDRCSSTTQEMGALCSTKPDGKHLLTGQK